MASVSLMREVILLSMISGKWKVLLSVPETTRSLVFIKKRISVILVGRKIKTGHMKNLFILLIALLITGALQAQLAIGTTTPAASAMLEVSSTSKGFLPPRMDSSARNAIASPATGLTIYNTSIKAFQVYNGTNWYSTIHFIGESYGGGIVFYIYDNGQHGLIASLNDQIQGIAWWNGVNRFTGSDGDGIISGVLNTTAIVATQLADNPTGNFAAKICADYSVTAGGIMYGDWYLPSDFELNLLFGQKNLVGGFANAWYWSSRESSQTAANVRDFATGVQSLFAKSTLGNVRAIRAF
jgi:hypothetical protein